ncbi:MAG: hypothetical protein ACXACU_15875 [Candidatus Hodarchaeales archaeon]|jgi:hypothetical protein
MATNKNQWAPNERGDKRNELMNGGIPDCLRRFNSANVGASWKTKCRKQLNFSIKNKRRFGK